MNPNVLITEDFVTNLLEQGAWSKAGIEVGSVTEEKLDEKKSKKSKKSGQDEGEPGEKNESKEETHVCPLCESELEEELSDECLIEHAEAMAELFASLNEEDDEDEDESDEDEDEDTEDSDEDEE